jgi:hypothetical protein
MIKVMQKFTPALVFGGQSKANRMIFNAPPMNKQDVPTRQLNAPAQLVRQITRHGRNDDTGLSESYLKLLADGGTNVQDGDLKNRNR